MQLRLSFHAIKAIREAKPFPYKAGGKGAVFVDDAVYDRLWAEYKQSGQTTFHRFIMEMCRGVSEAVGKERGEDASEEDHEDATSGERDVHGTDSPPVEGITP